METEDSGTRIQQTDWETWYQDEEVEEMPWFLPGLDEDFDKALSELNVPRGLRVLDLGSGPGTQAIELASRGYVVTGTDISETAVEKASKRADREGQHVVFLQDDILKTRLNGKPFDLVFDRGCFHTLPPEQRRAYLRTVSGLLKAKGYLLLKCFSHLQPGDDGPYRFRPDEIRGLFKGDFDVIGIEDSMFSGKHEPPPKAVFSVLRKR